MMFIVIVIIIIKSVYCRRDSLLGSKATKTKTKALFELRTTNINVWRLKEAIIEKHIIKNRNISYLITDLINTTGW